MLSPPRTVNATVFDKRAVRGLRKTTPCGAIDHQVEQAACQRLKPAAWKNGLQEEPFNRLRQSDDAGQVLRPGASLVLMAAAEENRIPAAEGNR